METKNVEQKKILRALRLMKLVRRNSLTISEMIEQLSYEEDGYKVDMQTISRYHKLIVALSLTLFNLYTTLDLIIFSNNFLTLNEHRWHRIKKKSTMV